MEAMVLGTAPAGVRASQATIARKRQRRYPSAPDAEAVGRAKQRCVKSHAQKVRKGADGVDGRKVEPKANKEQRLFAD